MDIKKRSYILITCGSKWITIYISNQTHFIGVVWRPKDQSVFP